MAQISLDIEQARATAATFDSSRSNIETSLNTMTGSVNQVLATWNGQSRQQFENQWSQWVQRLQAAMQELQGLANGLRREADEFEEISRNFIGS